MTHTILVVDDEIKIRNLLTMFLKKENFQVAEAANGLEAIRKVEQVQPALVILDLMMPVVDGIETCREIRKFSDVPVIMLTAKTEEEDRIQGLEIGADDYVTKPYSFRERCCAADLKLALSGRSGCIFRIWTLM